MVYQDNQLICQVCGRPFLWPGWAQEWRIATGVPGLPARCPRCRVGAALARLGTPTVLPAPDWEGIPMRTTTKSGIPGDPINTALEGTRTDLLAAFARIGARPADPLSLRDDLRLAEDAIRHGAYPAAPVSRLFLFDRVEDVAVETELGSVASRMHARFWESGRRDVATDRAVWLGALSLDTGIKLLRRDHIPVGTTHRIDPDLDAVRDLLLVILIEAGLVEAVVRRPGIGPTPDGRNGGGDPFFTDGEVVVMVLASPVVGQAPPAPTS
jgi:hypothetical protein